MRHTIDASKNSCSHVLKQESLNDQEDTPDNLQKGIHSYEKVFADWKKGITNEEMEQILTGSQAGPLGQPGGDLCQYSQRALAGQIVGDDRWL